MPTVVGETSTGEPIFEVRGVRLILRPDAAHFNRFITCSKCGRDLPGDAVLSPADLDLTVNPVICKDCVSTAGDLFPAVGRPPLVPPAQTPDAPAVTGPETMQEPAPPADEARVEALEQRLGEAVEGLRARGETERSELLAVLEGTSRRIDYVGERLAEQSQSVSAQVRDLEERLQHLQVTVDAGSAPTQSQAAIPEQANVDLERVEARLNERLEGLVAGVVSQRTELQTVLQEEMRQRLDQLEQGVAQAAGTGGPSLHALEKRIEETVERLTERAEVQAELRVALEGRVDELSAALRGGTSSAVGDPVRIASEDEALRREQKSLLRRFDEVVDRVQQLQASVEADKARAESDSVAPAQADIDLARVEEQLNQRFDRLAEKVARADDTEAEHRRSLEEQVEEGLSRIAAALESHRRELQTGLREGLAVVQAAVPTPASVNDSRVQALEERLEKSDYEVSELGELHAALDVGLGALRSEIGEVRSAVQKVTGEQADIQDRRDGFNRAPQAAAPAAGDSARGWKSGRKAETGANLAVAIEAAEILAREHQQLKAQVADLEKAAEAASAAAARASSLATASGPLRSDVRLLQEQLAEQNEALDDLGRAVERLRRKVVTPAAVTEPVAKPTPKPATKAAKTAKTAGPAPARKATKPR